MTNSSLLIQQEPIVAISTATGEAAISIVRMGGVGVFEIADRVFRKSNLHKSGQSDFSFLLADSHTAHHGFIIDHAGNTIDEVMAIIYRSPRSFTMEDTIEFNCHGGTIVTETVLQTLLDAGARLADAGEFTRRAFLNGRIDLVQAEAIGEMIHAKSHAAYRSAVSQLKGDLSKKLDSLRTDLLNACAMLELEFDFGEEDVEFQSRDDLKLKMYFLLTNLSELANSFRYGKIIQEGIKTTIIGKPNAGKSTLLNALLGKERAIVSSEAGTTRDFIQESFVHDGILFQLIDTAGLRNSSDQIESEGIKRSYEKIEEADLVLYLYDASSELVESELEFIQSIRSKYSHTKFLLVGNKRDLRRADLSDPILSQQSIDSIFISALSRSGLSELKSKMKSLAVDSEKLTDASVIVTNLRHYEAIKNAIENLNAAMILIDKNSETELIASDLRSALQHIGSVIGKVTTDDILNHIFSKFCIGK